MPSELTSKEVLQDANGFIYIHIPKTAGRSVLDAMGAKFVCQHLQMKDYISQLGMESVSSRFKFATVRNPWDRAVSWWKFFVYRPYMDVQPTFNDWVMKFSNWYNNRMDQLSYVRDLKGNIIIDQLIQFENIDVDYAKVQKSLPFMADTLQVIGKKVSFMESPFINNRQPVIGASGNKIIPPLSENYRDFYTSDDSINSIRKCNLELIEMFKYEF